ncbi:MAG: hypothetical protein NTNFB02_33060 [Nitrospira sp.]
MKLISCIYVEQMNPQNWKYANWSNTVLRGQFFRNAFHFSFTFHGNVRSKDGLFVFHDDRIIEQLRILTFGMKGWGDGFSECGYDNQCGMEDCRGDHDSL